MTPVLILGAGPAGLAAAICLSQRQIPYRILEAGDTPLSALRRLDPKMRLVSPPRYSKLPLMDELDDLEPYPTFEVLVERLEAYRRRHGVEIETGVRVESVVQNGDGLEVRCAGGRIERARHVVNATGMIATPHLPEAFDPKSCQLRWRHSRDVRQADLASARRLLVVGTGTSAVEAVATWMRVRPSDGAAHVAFRSRPRAVPHWIAGIDVHHFIALPERVPGWLPGLRRIVAHEPAVGRDLVVALRRREIEARPAVAEFGATQITFSDGSHLEPDLLVLATGYRHCAPHLGGLVARFSDGTMRLRACASTLTPGLFVLGAPLARNLASPYLRGIRRDAAYVARRIARAEGV